MSLAVGRRTRIRAHSGSPKDSNSLDREKRNLLIEYHRDEHLVVQPFRCNVEDLEVTIPEFGAHFRHFLRGQARVHRCCGNPALLQRLHLIFHERDEWGDDEGQSSEALQRWESALVDGQGPAE